MNCDRIAKVYRWLEYIAFGKNLERCRTYFLGSINRQRHALVLGDGDGRFIANYLRANSSGRADSVEISENMQALTQRRTNEVPGGAPRVNFICSDARSFQPRETYDLFVTHFFFDCFHEDEIDALVAHIHPAAEPYALWVVSEFRIPSGIVAGPLGAALIRAMYEFFARSTGLEVRRLPNYRRVLERRGFALREEQHHLAGLLVSELWVALETGRGVGNDRRNPQ